MGLNRRLDDAVAISDAESIDVHAHVVLEQTFGMAGRYGPELGPGERARFRVGDYELHGVPYRGSAFMDVDVRLAALDRCGIDFQVLSPNPLTYFHFIDGASAGEFCRRHNDILATLIAPHRDRLGAFAAVPMQNIEAAIVEAQRACAELGMLGVYIGTDFGRPLNDGALDPFYAALIELDAPLFIHPAPAGIDGPKGDANLAQFDLDIIIGFAAQETIAVASLIYGGVLERHPQLDVCISHGGGATAFLCGRLASAARKRPWASDSLRQDGAFEALLHRLWFDVHVHADDSLALLKQHTDPRRLVFGTNFAGWDQQPGVLRADARPYADNARRLLRAAARS